MIQNAPPLSLSSRDESRMEEVQHLAASGVLGIPALTALLSDPSWVVRRAVVAALARAGTPAVGALCDILRLDRANETRLAAAVDALVASGGEVEPAVLALAQHTQNPAIVCDVSQILGRRKSQGAVAELARWSAHSDDNVAVAALEALGRIGGAASIEPLLEAIRTRNFFRTFPAIAVLGQSGDPRVVAPLVELLAEPHYAAEAAAALGRTAQLTAVAPLARLLRSESDELVRTAARALTALRQRNIERFGDPAAAAAAFQAATRDEAITPRLTQAIQGADVTDTVALACVLGWLHDEAGVQALLALLDGDTAVAEQASSALRSLALEAEPAIRAALRTGDSARRQRLLPLLGARRGIVGELTSCIEDADPMVRALACDALGRIGDTSVVTQVFPLIADADARVAHSAIAAVQCLGSDEVRRHALSAARSPDPRMRRAALRIVSYFGYPEGLDVLLEAAADDDERIREVATAGLALLDEPRALAALVTTALHPSGPTRAATMRALAHAPKTPEILQALLAGLGDEDAWVRYYACQSLGRLNVTAAAEKVEGLLDDPAGQVRVAAIEAIARIGGDHALVALERASQAADLDVRRAALTGLGRLRRPGAFALLLHAFDSDDAVTRLAAIAAIADAPFGDDAVRALIRAGSDPDERVRGAAFSLLATRPDASASRWLIERLAVDDDRDRALTALAQPVDNRVETILSALETSDAATSTLLIEALLRMRRPAGNAAAGAALQMENVYARRAAAAALANVDTPAAKDALAQGATLDPDPEVRRICAAAG